MRALEMTFRSPSPHIKIEFQGGEPLLNFPLIEFVVDRANDMNRVEQRSLTFVIATNLALLDDHIIEFCRTHNINI